MPFTHTTFDSGIPESVQKLVEAYSSLVGQVIAQAKEKVIGPFVVVVHVGEQKAVAVPVEEMRAGLKDYPDQKTVDIVCDAGPESSARLVFIDGKNPNLLTVRVHFHEVLGDHFPVFSKTVGSA